MTSKTAVEGRRPTHMMFMLLSAMLLSSCRQSMADQAGYRPLEPSTLFSDGSSARPIPAGTVARGSEPTVRDVAEQSTLPVPLTRELLERGQDRFNIFCSPCHGETGNGQGIVVQRGLRHGPPSFHIDRLRQETVGHFFDVASNGFGGMPGYSPQVSNRDRWAIAAYVRALQYSQSASLQDLPPAEQKRLEAEK